MIYLIYNIEKSRLSCAGAYENAARIHLIITFISNIYFALQYLTPKRIKQVLLRNKNEIGNQKRRLQ